MWKRRKLAMHSGSCGYVGLGTNNESRSRFTSRSIRAQFVSIRSRLFRAHFSWIKQRAKCSRNTGFLLNPSKLKMASTTGAPPLRSRPSSYDYFDVDDILATQERVPSKIELQIYNLGFLDPSSEGKHLQPGIKLELPFWLAKELCSRRRKIVSVDTPKAFKEGYRQILKADANVVDLHKLGPYFYSFGTKLLHFDYDENPLMAKCFQEVRY